MRRKHLWTSWWLDVQRKLRNNLYDKITMKQIDTLKKLFTSHANATLSVGMSAYMKNNFPFFWIQTPLRRQLEKERMKSFTCETRDEVKKLSIELWNKQEREYHYAAIGLLEKYKKLWVEESIHHFEWMILHNSRWDSVDSIDTRLVWQYFLMFPKTKEKVALRWAKSDNIWLKRTAIQFQLLYKKQVDTELLEQIFAHTKDSLEFFIQKSMGWMLREYSKTNPARVRKYIKNNQLSKLTVREGSKYI